MLSSFKYLAEKLIHLSRTMKYTGLFSRQVTLRATLWQPLHLSWRGDWEVNIVVSGAFQDNLETYGLIH
jgi:hypothetical protein